MFHEVKIFDKKGKVKKVLSSKKLSNKYWDSFFHNPWSESMQKKKGRGRKPRPVDFDDGLTPNPPPWLSWKVKITPSRGKQIATTL